MKWISRHVLFSPTLCYAVGCAFVLILGLEAGLRLRPIEESMPAPLYAPNYTPLNEKYAALSRLDAPLDCLVVGSSLVFSGIDIAVMSQAYEEASGKPLACFNFGINYLSLSTAEPLLRLLAAEFQPRFMILGITPRDFLDYQDNHEYLLQEQLPQLPWWQHKLGNWHWRGWLLETSYIYRSYTLIPQMLALDGQRSKLDFLTQQLGYEPNLSYNWFAPRFGNYFDMSAGLPLSAADSLAMAALATWQQMPLLILEIPTTGLYKDQFGGESSYDALVTELWLPLANNPRISLWRLPDLPFLQLDDWADVIHLYYTGAWKFSYWLGQQLAVGEGETFLPPSVSPVVTPDWNANYAMTNTINAAWRASGFDLIPATATVFDPRPSAESHAKQLMFLGIAVTHNPALMPQEVDDTFELMHLLEQAQFEDSLSLSEAEGAALAQWRIDKNGAHLSTVPIDYLLVTEKWVQFLTAEERDQLNDSRYYQLIGEWWNLAELQTYALYRIGRAE